MHERVVGLANGTIKSRAGGEKTERAKGGKKTARLHLAVVLKSYE